MTDGQIPAGWYPDPAGDTTRIRYWDGASWTEQTQLYASQPLPQNTLIVPTQPIYAPNQEPVFTVNNQPVKNRKGMATAALVLGIVGIPLSCCAYLAIIPGVLAVIFGILGIKSTRRGVAIAGIVIGAIAIIAGIVMTFVALDIINDPTKYGLPADYLDQFTT